MQMWSVNMEAISFVFVYLPWMTQRLSLLDRPHASWSGWSRPPRREKIEMHEENIMTLIPSTECWFAMLNVHFKVFRQYLKALYLRLWTQNIPKLFFGGVLVSYFLKCVLLVLRWLMVNSRLEVINIKRYGWSICIQTQPSGRQK